MAKADISSKRNDVTCIIGSDIFFFFFFFFARNMPPKALAGQLIMDAQDWNFNKKKEQIPLDGQHIVCHGLPHQPWRVGPQKSPAKNCGYATKP
jgi:hypothetical protein